MVEVDSLYTEIINSQTLRGLGVTYTFKSFNGVQNPWVTDSKFTDVIGDFDFLFNFYGHPSHVICGDVYPSGLRCYSDNTFGNYETGIVDSCEHYGLYVGVEELESTDIKLWPNPVTDVLHLQNSYQGITNISVFDITGNLLLITKFQGNNQLLELDLSAFQKGVYFLRISSEKRKVLKKIVKM